MSSDFRQAGRILLLDKDPWECIYCGNFLVLVYSVPVPCRVGGVCLLTVALIFVVRELLQNLELQRRQGRQCERLLDKLLCILLP